MPCASGAARHVGDAGEGGQRRRDHRQARGEVLVDLHREDALGQRVARVGDQPGVGRPQHVGQLAVGAGAEQVDVRLGRQRRDVGAGIARPDGAHQRKRPGRSQARQLDQQGDVQLDGHDRAGEHDPGRRQRGHVGVQRGGWARLKGLREELGVGYVRCVEDVARDRPQPLREGGRARQHEVRARGEARLGRAEARGVDALVGGDVVDAVVDDQRRVERVDQHLGLGNVGPQDRPSQAQPAGRAAQPARGAGGR